MDTKKAIEQLIKIAIKQQQIISKLAQQGLPPDADPRSKIDMGEGGQLRAPSEAPPAQDLGAGGFTKTPQKDMWGLLLKAWPQIVRPYPKLHKTPLENVVQTINFDWRKDTYVVFFKPKVSVNLMNLINKNVQKLIPQVSMPAGNYSVESRPA